MRLSKKQVRRYSWHEAGHVTHALRVGLPFHAAWVRTDDTELPPDGMAGRMSLGVESMGAMIGRPGATFYATASEMVENFMAGVAGERIMRRTKKAGRFTARDYFSGARSDYENARDIIAQRNNDPRCKIRIVAYGWYINRALENAWKTLRRKRDALKAIAEALTERGYLSYEECKKLYEENA
jgi:hypothetical protein